MLHTARRRLLFFEWAPKSLFSRANLMMNFDDVFFADQEPLTSPRPKPSSEIEFNWNDFDLYSSMSMPGTISPSRPNRVADLRVEPMSFCDCKFNLDYPSLQTNVSPVKMNVPVMRMNQANDYQKTTQIKPKTCLRKKRAGGTIPQVFRPFLSLESTEATIHQLRAAITTRQTYN